MVNEIHEKNTVYDKQIAPELTEMLLNVSSIGTNDQQQSFGPLVDCAVD